MKLVLYYLETKAPAWIDAGRSEYIEKIRPFVAFELKQLKSPAGSRENAEVKRRQEGQLLLKNLDPKDLLILFDEAGKKHKSSEDFAVDLGRALESGKSRVAFAIGGPYGFSAEVRARASSSWSLSTLTMNHWLAQMVALEQIYRGFTILKGIPYHNR